MSKIKIPGASFFSRILIAVILLCGQFLSAQDTLVVRDLHLWTGVKLEKTFGKDWMVFVAPELRLKHDISEINNYFFETGLRYRINKNFALEGQYRITFDKKKDDSYELLTRYALDLRYKGRLDFMSISYRLRYQKEVEGWNLADPGIPYQKYVRNRIRFRYEDMGRFKPYVSAEIFQLFEAFQEARFEYIRIMGGVKYGHSGLGTFDLAYGVNLEFADTNPARIYTIKLNYTYSF